MPDLPSHIILVPQGAEYQAVCRGLSLVSPPMPSVFSIPVGAIPLTQRLQQFQQQGLFSKRSQLNVLLMGLCGSLKCEHRVGDVVLYKQSLSALDSKTVASYACDRTLTNLIHQKLQQQTALVTAFTSDRVIWSAAEKQELGQIYAADVVDMEGAIALEILSQTGVNVATLRVVSDDAEHNIPDLTGVFSEDGALQPLPMAIAMLRQPVGAVRLIRGSLQSLRILQQVTTALFTRPDIS